jgi:DNA-binding MarR family transcriptional regulator
VPDSDITPQVKRFIHETINSVEQLEVLLFLVSNPEQEWSGADVADRLRASFDSVSAKLADLQAAQLLAVRRDEEKGLLYRYSPGSSALANEVAASLTRAYDEGKDTLIQLIYTKPLANIRYFADAFRLRKDG